MWDRHLKRTADRWPQQVVEWIKFGLRKKEKCGAEVKNWLEKMSVEREEKIGNGR